MHHPTDVPPCPDWCDRPADHLDSHELTVDQATWPDVAVRVTQDTGPVQVRLGIGSAQVELTDIEADRLSEYLARAATRLRRIDGRLGR